MNKNSKNDERINLVKQFIKFGIVGLSNTIISYTVYSLTLVLIRAFFFEWKYDYLVAQILAFLISVTWAFYWNLKYVFKLQNIEKKELWKSYGKTVVSYSFTGLFLNTILLILWVDYIGISEYIAPLLNLCISVPVNFIMNKIWAFNVKQY